MQPPTTKFLSGCHLRKDGSAVHGAEPAADRPELPEHCDPPADAPGGKVYT